MPSTSVSSRWFVRVTIPHTGVIPKWDKVKEWIDVQKYLLVFHKGSSATSREHIHFVIELSSQLQKQSIDTRFRKLFGVKGRSDYSSKIWDGNENVFAYMFHEYIRLPLEEKPNAIISVKGYADEDVSRFIQLSHSFEEDVKPEKKKLKQLLANEFHIGLNFSLRDMLEFTLKKVRTKEICYPGDFIVKKTIQEVFIQQGSDEQFNFMGNQIYANIFREY